MSELDDRLRALAGTAERGGRLDAAALIRARSDTRRRRRRAGVAASGVVLAVALGAGITFGRPSPGPGPAPLPGPPISTPSASPTPSVVPDPSVSSSPSPAESSELPPSSEPPPIVPPSSDPATTSPAGDVFSGERQTLLQPVDSSSTFRVGSDLRVELSGTYDDDALFVLTEIGNDRYWIQTATLRAGGEAYCLAARDGEVFADACDASARNQLFRFRNTGTSEGRPKYTIWTGADTYLVQDPRRELNPGGTGVVAAQIGEGTPDIDTPFVLPDRGAAAMPLLD